MCNEANMGKFVTFLSKEENRKIPVFGFIIEALGHLTISRDTKAVKSERNAMLDIIAERQLKAEAGLCPPLVIYPEGCTSNSKYVLQFKRGAFYTLRSVKPYFTQTKCLTSFMPVHGDPSSLVDYVIMSFAVGICIYTLNDLPVF